MGSAASSSDWQRDLQAQSIDELIGVAPTNWHSNDSPPPGILSLPGNKSTNDQKGSCFRANVRSINEENLKTGKALGGFLLKQREGIESWLGGSAICLPRGGVYVPTSVGPIQFGCPPETIKDCMAKGLDVPCFFVVPTQIFSRRQGLSLYEFEFPCYFNYFVKKRKTTFITTAEVEPRIKMILQETLCGPCEFDLRREFTRQYRDLMPDLAFEGAALRDNGLDYDALVEFVQFVDTPMDQKLALMYEQNAVNSFDPGSELGAHLDTLELPISTATVHAGNAIVNVELWENPKYRSCMQEGTSIRQQHQYRTYRVYDELQHSVENSVPKTLTASVPESNGMFVHRPQPQRSPNWGSFEPPTFGVTVLGASHGFDHEGRTAGFVLWTNGFGTLVDPPPYCTEYLRDVEGISPHKINGLIITHCHADHDCGALQKILDEGRVKSLFDPIEVSPHVPMDLNGAELTMFYSWHTIPCVGFKAEFGGKSFIYSADHMNDPERLKAEWESGVESNTLGLTEYKLNEGRRNFLLNFDWNVDCIFHELGVPPIHTPKEILLALPEEVRTKRLFVIHVSEKAVPQGLRRARPGGSETIAIIPYSMDPANEVRRKQLYLEQIPFLSGISLWHAFRLLNLAREVPYKKGDVILEEGQIDEHFYILETGWICMKKEPSILVRLRALQLGNPDLEDEIEDLICGMATQTDTVERRRFQAALKQHVESAAASERKYKLSMDHDLLQWAMGDVAGEKGSVEATMRRHSATSTGPMVPICDVKMRYAPAGSFFNGRAILCDKWHTHSANNVDDLASPYTVVAVTDVTCLKIDRHQWLPLLTSVGGARDDVRRDITSIHQHLTDLEEFAASNALFSTMTQRQFMSIASLVQRKRCNAGEELWTTEKQPDMAVLLLSGKLKLEIIRKTVASRTCSGSGTYLDGQSNIEGTQNISKIESENPIMRVISATKTTLSGSSAAAFTKSEHTLHCGAFVAAANKAWTADSYDESYCLKAADACTILTITNEGFEELSMLFPGLLMATADEVIVL